MAEAAKKAAYRALSNRLYGNTAVAMDVYLQYVPEKVVRPYLLVTNQAGGERHFHNRVQDPELIFLIKAVALDPGAALDLMQEARDLLDDQGEQELGGVVGGVDWYIHRVRVEEHISQSYLTGTTRIFEEGFQVRIVMQER